MSKEKTNEIRQEIELPDGINASITGDLMEISGAKGKTEKLLKQRRVSILVNNGKILLETKSGTKKDKKIMGSITAHINNMIKGSLQSHTYTLKICSGHFPMNVSISGNKLIVKNFLGEKVPRTLQLKADADVKIEGDLIHVTSANKEITGQVSADIEQLTRRPGYDTRVFQDGCYIISKDGKELK